MKNKTSFKEYLESKELLRMAGEELPRVKEVYAVEKYCSVPVLEADGEVTYLKFKPNDVIEILWENTPGERTPKQFTILSEDEVKIFAWSNAKIRSWVGKMTTEI